MLAMQLDAPFGIEHLKAVNLCPPPGPGPDEIRVSVRASSTNYHDYAIVQGMIPTASGRIPLSDGCGEVIEVGSAVSEFAPGDAVLSVFYPNWEDGRPGPRHLRGIPGDHVDGFARSEITRSATAFTRAPQGYSHIEAATLPCAALTAWRSLQQGGIMSGETVLVQGSGGVSVFALQFAKAAGARVIATTSSKQKFDRLLRIGADHVLNYRDTPDWGREIGNITGGGVDHVIEIGGAGTLDQSIAAVRNGGHIALIGVLAGRSAPVATVKLMAKQVRLIGVTVGSRRQQLDMIRAIEVNGIKPVIDRSFALSELTEAFRYQASGQHFGKISIATDPCSL